ncbi:hypothetical protein ACFWN1_14660 [Streptomyces sp. NPDC058459]|uniref:hypothetical protein n=1 Tax=Streptomyces sp. NPDC058459 TaxID=3346508 RepID=UPI0036572E8B
MPKFRKKPIEIDAIQFTGDNVQEIWDAFGAVGIYGPTEKNPDHLILTTVHGDEAPARAADWIIPDGKPGTFYPCKPDIFAATYEAAASCQASSDAPNALGAERGTLPAGHTGRHANGNLTWPTPAATEATELETTARVLSALHRSAEDTVTRVITLHEQWVAAGPPPLGASLARWWDARLTEQHNAIHPPEQSDTPS